MLVPWRVVGRKGDGGLEYQSFSENVCSLLFEQSDGNDTLGNWHNTL